MQHGTTTIIGSSAAVLQMRNQISCAARTDENVLIEGESGTGKELAARLIHETGPRKDKPFVAVNCAAMPGELLESELFGHARGSFTGAVKDNEGLLVQADGGVVFLDEIGDMPLLLQAKILRVLEERRVRQVGGHKERDVNMLVIAATNRNIQDEVSRRRFRDDLYYRLAVMEVHTPSLRERPGDIPELLNHFLDVHAKKRGEEKKHVDDAAMEMLSKEPWPGNIRQLRNMAIRLHAVSPTNTITTDDVRSIHWLSHAIPTLAQRTVMSADSIAGLFDGWPTMREVRDKYLQILMEHHKGNISSVARTIGMSRRSMHRLLDESGSGNRKARIKQ